MNYFAHGLHYIDRPYFLAGTAVPDWLSVADRGVRTRPNRALPFAEGGRDPTSEVAHGILTHHEDDGWFHESRAFHETTGELGRMFRELLGPEDGFRPGFLGHIAMELLLDGVLIAAQPKRLSDYYDALAEIDPRVVEDAVNQMARGTTDRLAPLIPLFHREQFLWDYLEPGRLLVRLNQVLRRIKLKPLPDPAIEVLSAGWMLVAARTTDLLPDPRFAFLTAPPSERISKAG